jgi:myo-inositol-1(or 4)-monophosphatase
MTSIRSALDADWLGVCRRAVAGLEEILTDAPSTQERAEETGTRGSGGDRTLVIDRAAEAVVFEELDALHQLGHGFRVVSEEQGEVDYGDPRVVVIIDPIDGSLNAKRRISHYAISIAVADGPTMADVAFGYVYDFGPGEEWSARRGEGAWLNGIRLDPELPERRSSDGRIEVLGIEAADPRWVSGSVDELVSSAYRLRVLGTIASTLCQVAAARFDGMVSLRRARGVDSAAGQLIAREGGALVTFPGCDPPLSAPLDVAPRAPVVAARSPETLERLARIPQ